MAAPLSPERGSPVAIAMRTPFPWRRGRGHVLRSMRSALWRRSVSGWPRWRASDGRALLPVPVLVLSPPAGDMSTAMNFSSKSFKPRPPDKGAFPLDHFGECSAFKERFMECLRDSGYESGACRQRAMAYLQCRMERQLMANEPLEKLGFKDLIDEKSEEKREKS
ncbi:LOW QUALITY PROTEIN: cytochrome c oxidase assembly protein COX19 [Lathamus discolor]|uniref:LOW QUALITY PROTEIN: cytochrome c oxidase assembly protein COX19 n=1 Tax=Lathamus discolor TaxID=678569 RepID=UPI0032B795A9